jgi:hypothetical protein
VLLVAPGTKLLKLDRVVQSIDGDPVEWRVALSAMADKFYVAGLD